MRYFAIGDEDTILGFGLVGVDGATARDADDAARIFSRVIGDDSVGIVIITERVADLIRDAVDRYMFTEDFPLILEVPDRNGSIADRPTLRQTANQAIGVSV